MNFILEAGVDIKSVSVIFWFHLNIGKKKKDYATILL